jgi:hypothetical protein
VLNQLPSALAMAGVAALMLSPGLFVGPSLDPAVFVHVASQLRLGDTLYVDAWDHKPPGIYLLYALGQGLLPVLDPWMVAWLLSVVATTGVGLLVAAVARRLNVAPGVALLAGLAAVAAMSQYLLALGGGLTEPVALMPLCGAFLLALRQGGLWRHMTAGALLAVTLLVAIPLLPGVIAVVWLATRTGGARALAGMAVGAAAPAVVTAAWLGASGALLAAVDAVVGYSAAYRLTNDASGWVLSAPVITWTVLALLVLVVPASLGLLVALRNGALRRGVAMAAAAWIVLSIALFVYQGRFFAHYAIPMAVPLAVLGAIGFERLAALAGRTRGPLGPAVAYGPMILALLISVAAGLAGGRMEWLPVARDHERSERVATAIRDLTAEDEPIWIWGNEPQLYLEASRQSATAYPYLYPLVTPGYTTPAMVEAAATSLRADSPRVIVDAGSRAPGVVGFQQLLIPRPLTSDGRDLDILDPLRTVVREGYAQAETVDGWVLYVRADR